MGYATISATRRFVLPDAFRNAVESEWGRANMRGRQVACFLEGPSFDTAGNLHVVDIPFGRIFRISPDGRWELLSWHDGWPCGSKVHRDGRIFIADYRRGVLQLLQGDAAPQEVSTSFHTEGFRGCNDLFFSSTGDLWFTDQGQTGLQDPAGRVFRLDTKGKLTSLIANVPSPNGLVMNLEETQLLVAVTRANAIWRLPLMDDGSVSKAGLFIQLSGGMAGPDGLALDSEGGLVVAHPGIGVWRFDVMGRPTHLVEAPAGSVWTNVAFGGQDMRELFIVDSLSGCILSAQMPFAGKTMFSHS